LLPLRAFTAVLVALSIAAAPCAWQQPPAERGITGLVLDPDGAPVTGGNVALMTSSTARVMAAIDRSGGFRIVAERDGRHALFVSVPGYAPYRAYLTVPSTRSMALPGITLSAATYFHARFVTTDGEQLAATGLRHRSIDLDGATIHDPLDHVRNQIELDGSITIGPLPAGRTLLAFDRAPYAQTRVRDVNVTGTDKVIEGGTIPIQPGGQLHVDIVDAAGQPVPRHQVWIEDAARPSPLSFPMARTNEQGRALFDRLASGRYRVFTQTPERCGRINLTVSKLVSAGGSDATRTRIVVGGRAAFRITSSLGPLFGRGVAVAPDAPSGAPWQPQFSDTLIRSRGMLPAPLTAPPTCGGVTDNDGRVVLAPFPPGPAQLRVILFNSSYFARLTVPENGGEMVIKVPDGLMPVRVTNRANGNPVSARLTWTGGGGRVEAGTTPNGDALLEGVGTIGGTLTIESREYQTLEGSFTETPDTLQEVALVPTPSGRLTVQVISDSAEPIASAVVQLLPRGPGDAGEFAAVNPKGVAAFNEVPGGTLRFSAHAEGFKPGAATVAEESRASITITLARIAGK
jgi:hypothetical protein